MMVNQEPMVLRASPDSTERLVLLVPLDPRVKLVLQENPVIPVQSAQSAQSAQSDPSVQLDPQALLLRNQNILNQFTNCD